MFVFLVLGQRPGGVPYVLGVFTTEAGAQAHVSRWMQKHPDGSAHVERFAVLNGNNGRW
jgi:hypothetical protein